MKQIKEKSIRIIGLLITLLLYLILSLETIRYLFGINSFSVFIYTILLLIIIPIFYDWICQELTFVK